MVGGTMFFSHFMVYKKGPLSRVWLAAHWDKKLTKAHIFEICIESSVEGILQPKAKMALRTTGHLLLGVVRIYSRKAKYLLADCNEAFVKIKMAFRPGMVDLPEGNREASLAAITLPEVFHDFENMGDMTIDVDTPNTRNQCRAEEITIKEDYGTLSLMTEDAFGELAFNDPDIANDATNIDEAFDHTGLIIASEQPEITSDKEQKETQDEVSPADLVEAEVKEKETPEDTDATVGCEFFGTGLFDDAPIGPAPAENQPTSDDAQLQLQQKNLEDTDDDLYGSTKKKSFSDSKLLPASNPTRDLSRKKLFKQRGVCPMMHVGHTSRNPTPYTMKGDFGPASAGLPSGPSSPGSIAPENLTEEIEGVVGAPEPQKSQLPVVEDNSAVSVNQTTLIPNDSEAFALAPLDTTVYRGMERGRSKRKRKLIVDEIKNISGEEMKNQLSDTRDIITTLDLAPPTKRLMHWKETGGVEKLFALPGHSITSRILSRLYMRHLTTRPMDEEPEPDADVEGPYSSDVELGRASKKPRLEEPDQTTEIAFPEQVPLEVDQSQPLVEEPTTVPDVETENLIINKEVEDPAPKLPEMVIDNSLILPAEPSTSLLPIPEEIENIAESVADIKEPEKEVEPRKEDAVSDLFDTLTANTGNAASTTNAASATAPTTTNETEEIMNSEDAEKNEQNNILPLDDDDDVGGPASVGPPEEQLADETYEQFEERVHSKRASVMLHVMKRNLDAGYSIPFSAVVRGNKRKQVAQKFYTLLVLKKQQSVEMEQSKAYEEVYISRGPQYEDLFA